MISSGNFSGTPEDIYNITTQSQIASYYLGLNSIPSIINSPLRKDSKPSMGIYSPDGNDVNFIDFATGEKGTIYTLLRRMWNLSYPETLGKIYKDFKKEPPLNVSVKQSSPSHKVHIERQGSSDLKCKVREWRDYDIEYWKSYGISLKWLKYADIYPISHTIIVKHGERYVINADKYAYAYVEFKEGKVTLKIYQPFNKSGFKWTNKHDRSVISLWTKVPEYGEKICICSSLKDALCLWANIGIPSLSLQGEGYSMSDTAVKELKRRYRRIYILLDNDKAGIIDAERLAESTGFTNIVLPSEYGAKDISDLYLTLKNKELFKKIILSLFNNFNT